MTEPEAPRALTPEELEDRARRADSSTRGVLAGVLGLEALVVLLLPVALRASHSLGVTRTVVLIVFALVLIAAAGALRRPRGIAIGSAMQALVMLTGVWLVAMFVLAAIFWAVWYRVLVLRRDVVGTPGGLRMLIS